VLIVNLFIQKPKMHSFLPCVEFLSIICKNIIDLNKNVLRFAMSEVILTFSGNALCAFVFYVSAIDRYVCMYQNCMSHVVVIVNMWGK